MFLPDRRFEEKLAKPFLSFLQKMILSHKKGVFNSFKKKHTWFVRIGSASEKKFGFK
jgi:hypothetical protein